MDVRFYGVYRGIVTNGNDPDDLSRVRARIPQVFGETESNWAWPCFHPGSSTVPQIGDGVWIMFEAGDPRQPVWLGVWREA